jgi:hypothetical protein
MKKTQIEIPVVKNHILIVGCCGTGKTWVMRELYKKMNATGELRGFRLGLIKFVQGARAALAGDYDGSIFEGSDRLSRAAVKDVEKVTMYALKKGVTFIWEGDRWTNRRFILTAKPYIIRIRGTGESGRKQRGTKQTDRHLKQIETRVSRISVDTEVESSEAALQLILDLLKMKI